MKKSILVFLALLGLIINVKAQCTPPATFAVGPFVVLCPGTTVINAGVTSQSNYTYTWTPPSGAGITCSSCFATSVNMGGTYSVVITNTTTGCSNTNFVTVNQAMMSVNISGTDTICSGDSDLLIASASGGGITYTWSTGSNASSINVTPSITTIYTVNASSPAGCSGTKSFTVHVSPCAGIKEANLISGIKLSPNPNNGQFNLKIEAQLENADLIIYNSIGQIVWKQKVMTGNNEINGSSLSKDIYHYSIQNNKQVVGRGKLLIQ